MHLCYGSSSLRHAPQLRAIFRSLTHGKRLQAAKHLRKLSRLSWFVCFNTETKPRNHLCFCFCAARAGARQKCASCQIPHAMLMSRRRAHCNPVARARLTAPILARHSKALLPVGVEAEAERPVARPRTRTGLGAQAARSSTPNLHTKNLPTKICRLKLSGKSPKDIKIPAAQSRL